MRIDEDVYLIGSGALGAGYSHPSDCNVYAVRCGEEYWLIDAGAGQETDRLLENLCADGVAPERVRRLLLTHGHLDHSGGARWLRERCHLQVCASIETAKALASGDEEAISLAAAKRAGIYPANFPFEPCPVDCVYDGGEVWDFTGGSIEVLRTPGHSRDMLSYLIRLNGRLLLFGGDTIFHGGRILLSDVYDCDVPAYCRSIRLLANYRIDALFPGHMMWTVRDAHAHVQKAVEHLGRLLLPPNLI